ncbi:MAG: hypothetical protein H0X71_11930 [Rubrobacter sp.]|nr:hypothetical protein [Rubrobacter sp.]
MSYNPEQPGRRCAHLYPVRVVVTEELRRARCLGCGMVGPASGSLAGAMRALRVSVSGIQPARSLASRRPGSDNLGYLVPGGTGPCPSPH